MHTEILNQIIEVQEREETLSTGISVFRAAITLFKVSGDSSARSVLATFKAHK